MPPTPRGRPKQSLSSISATKSTGKLPTRDTLSELSQNLLNPDDEIEKRKTITMASIDGKKTLGITPEMLDHFKHERKNFVEYICDNIEECDYNLEIYGWSRKKYIPASFYDNFLNSDLNVKQLTLRGRGLWDTCKCPDPKSTPSCTIPFERTTKIERLYIMRPFQISACALIDLIARSPNLKIFRFYGVLIKETHYDSFESARFLSELERFYWPWCNRKRHLPTIRTLVKRNDTINTFYSNGDTTCELLGSDLLPNLKNLSLILNESWACKDNKLKRPNRYLRKVVCLCLAKQLEALEIRTFKLDLEDYECDDEIDSSVRRLYENYQLTFWENVAKLPKLKYLAIYGAWELDGVARELARHGLQIEHLKTNLVPSSLIPAIDAGEDLLVLSMCDSIKELRKLTKLRSLHFACHENLANIDLKTVKSIMELADLIWVFDLRIVFSQEVEELITNIIRRGNQQGKVFNVKLHIETNKKDCANTYIETVVKFSSNQSSSIRQQLQSVVEQEARDKFGRNSYKNFHLWGIEQVGNREHTVFDKLKADWDRYNDIFQPVDMFA